MTVDVTNRVTVDVTRFVCAEVDKDEMIDLLDGYRVDPTTERAPLPPARPRLLPTEYEPVKYVNVAHWQRNLKSNLPIISNFAKFEP